MEASPRIPRPVVAVSGHPAPGAPTGQLADLAARALAVRLSSLTGREVAAVAIELAGGGRAQNEARELLATAGVAVIATPAAPTGATALLRTFLGALPARILRGAIVVPMVTARHEREALSTELRLRDLLAGYGAACPTRALILTADTAAPDGPIETWLAEAAPTLSSVARDAA
jgi:hypothetical protein